jgi:uncharacterized protein (DUF1330 family)
MNVFICHFCCFGQSWEKVKINSMSAFVLVEVDIHDDTLYEEYKKLTPATVEAYGGKFVVRGLAVEALEGEWKHDRLVVLEFPDKSTALNWYNSPEYRHARTIREGAASANFFIVG